MASNPRGLSDRAIEVLIREDKCPMCLGELDTGWECNDCDFDAQPLAERFLHAKAAMTPEKRLAEAVDEQENAYKEASTRMTWAGIPDSDNLNLKILANRVKDALAAYRAAKGEGTDTACIEGKRTPTVDLGPVLPAPPKEESR